jgi:hypothetical protein
MIALALSADAQFDISKEKHTHVQSVIPTWRRSSRQSLEAALIPRRNQ